MKKSILYTACAAAFIAVGIAGCAIERSPYTLDNAADTLAMHIVEAWGGAQAWTSLPYLQFEFAIDNEGTRQPVARHLWDRFNGHYRVEQTGEGDTTFVILFNVNSQEGKAFANGEPLSPEHSAQLVEQGYRRFINDTYWMLAPTKVFDPGVHRQFEEDSLSNEYAVLSLSFDGVGLTPGDRYWLYADRETHRVEKWAFILQGNPDADPSYFYWEGYEEHPAPEGSIRISTRKAARGADRAILTDRIGTPEHVDQELFEDPHPRL